MTDEERDRLIIEMHTDLKWVKDYIGTLNKFKLMCAGALIAAALSLISQARF